MAVDYSSGAVHATNVLHFLCHETGGLGASDVSNMVQDLGTAWVNDIWKGVSSDGWTTTQFTAVYAKIEGQPGVKRVRLADATLGSQAHSADYANTAWLINWETSDPRRGGKPRSYLPGVYQTSEADAADISTGVVSAVNTGIGTFLTHLAGLTKGQLVCDNLVEYSTVNGKAYRNAGATFPILSGVCSGIIATQRRRVDRLRA